MSGRDGTPSQVRTGWDTPFQGRDRGYPHPRSGGVVPRVPPSRSQVSMACTMPLAFTQEDLFVYNPNTFSLKLPNKAGSLIQLDNYKIMLPDTMTLRTQV